MSRDSRGRTLHLPCSRWVTEERTRLNRLDFFSIASIRTHLVTLNQWVTTQFKNLAIESYLILLPETHSLQLFPKTDLSLCHHSARISVACVRQVET